MGDGLVESDIRHAEALHHLRTSITGDVDVAYHPSMSVSDYKESLCFIVMLEHAPDVLDYSDSLDQTEFFRFVDVVLFHIGEFLIVISPSLW